MRAERRRRLARTIAVIGALTVAVAWVSIRALIDNTGPVATGPSRSPHGGPVGASPSTSAVAPAPQPIPGYLLIADRGNNRLLLVDQRKRIIWTYPRPGVRPSFPFRFDDDAFFSPDWRSIISNQEEQQTIEVISFPQGKVLWHYGHVNVRGTRTDT
jgi:hypothetical protein